MREELAPQPPTLQLQEDLSTVRSYSELLKEISLVVADLTTAEEDKERSHRYSGSIELIKVRISNLATKPYYDQLQSATSPPPSGSKSAEKHIESVTELEEVSLRHSEPLRSSLISANQPFPFIPFHPSKTMLSSLPPELLCQIIESTVPHTFHTTTYRDRQRTLRSLSLVSKQIRAIAQPLLFEIIWIQTPGTLERYKTSIRSFKERNRRAGEIRRTERVVVEPDDWHAPDELTREALAKEVVRLFSSVKSLTWDFGFLAFEKLPPLHEFSNLSSLHLSRICFEPGNLPILPNLQHLSMVGVEASMAALLDPAVVPSLKHFSLVDTSPERVSQLKQSRIVDLLPQLETIYLNTPLWLNPDLNFHHPFADRTLVNCHSSGQYIALLASPVLAPHVRLRGVWLKLEAPAIGRLEHELAQIAPALKRNPSLAVRSLYLDSSLQPSSSLPSELRGSIEELVDTCKERKIDLVFDPTPRYWCVDSCISAEFIRRQSRSKNLGERGDSQ